MGHTPEEGDRQNPWGQEDQSYGNSGGSWEIQQGSTIFYGNRNGS